jgi:hypothetical protein
MRALGLTADASGRKQLEMAVRARSNGDACSLKNLLNPDRPARPVWRSGVLKEELVAAAVPVTDKVMRIRTSMLPFARILSAQIGASTLGLGAAAVFLREQAGFADTMTRLKVPSFSYFLRLYPQLEVTTGRTGGHSTVRNKNGSAF